MTCDSCAGAHRDKRKRARRGLGVGSTTQTEKATVEYDPAEVTHGASRRGEQVGYSARSPRREPAVEEDPTEALRRRRIFAAVLSAAGAADGMIPALSVHYCRARARRLAPSRASGRAGIPRRRRKNLSHAAATMDTLISLGTSPTWGWSGWSLFFIDTGRNRDEDAVRARPVAGPAGTESDLHGGAAVVVNFLLEAEYSRLAPTSRRRPRCARSSSRRRSRDMEPDGGEQGVPIEELRIGDRLSSAPARRSHRTGSLVEGRSAVDQSLLTGESVPVEVAPGDAVAGARSTSARLVVRAERVGADTALAGQDSRGSSPPPQSGKGRSSGSPMRVRGHNSSRS